MNKQQFITALSDKGFNLTDYQLQQLQQYFELLVEWNEKINLTAITDEEDVYLKHFYDSMSLAFYYDLSQVDTLCDVGAGAGFPSIPLKILYPHLKVTIIDSLNKRIKFLEHLSSELQLVDMSFVHARAEEAGKNKAYREQFEVVTARAVARMSVLSELCLPLVKIGGQFVALKAQQTQEELQEGRQAIATLGGKLVRIEDFILPIEQAERHIVVIDKRKQTPNKYPRKPGTPNKEPIQ